MQAHIKKYFEKIEEHMVCPITYVKFKDPVLTEDGTTYERQAIQNWLRTRSKSPCTNIPLRTRLLFNNRSLKNMIDLISTQTTKLLQQSQRQEEKQSKLLTDSSNKLLQLSSKYDNSIKRLMLQKSKHQLQQAKLTAQIKKIQKMLQSQKFIKSEIQAFYKQKLRKQRQSAIEIKQQIEEVEQDLKNQAIMYQEQIQYRDELIEKLKQRIRYLQKEVINRLKQTMEFCQQWKSVYGEPYHMERKILKFSREFANSDQEWCRIQQNKIEQRQSSKSKNEVQIEQTQLTRYLCLQKSEKQKEIQEQNPQKRQNQQSVSIQKDNIQNQEMNRQEINNKFLKQPQKLIKKQFQISNQTTDCIKVQKKYKNQQMLTLCTFQSIKKQNLISNKVQKSKRLKHYSNLTFIKIQKSIKISQQNMPLLQNQHGQQFVIKKRMNKRLQLVPTEHIYLCSNSQRQVKSANQKGNYMLQIILCFCLILLTQYSLKI